MRRTHLRVDMCIKCYYVRRLIRDAMSVDDGYDGESTRHELDFCTRVVNDAQRSSANHLNPAGGSSLSLTA